MAEQAEIDFTAGAERLEGLVAANAQQIETKGEHLSRLKALEVENEKLKLKNVDLARQVAEMIDLRSKRMVRGSNPVTSFDAESTNRVFRKAQIQDFARVFSTAGGKGLTDEQAHDDVGLVSHTPRIGDMKRAGLLVGTGERRATKSGSKAKVYKLTEYGQKLMRELNEGEK